MGDGRLPVVIGGRLERVMRSEVPEYCDERFYSALDIWYRWRMFGNALPFAGGWAEQPAHIVTVIETLEAAYKEHERKSG